MDIEKSERRPRSRRRYWPHGIWVVGVVTFATYLLVGQSLVRWPPPYALLGSPQAVGPWPGRAFEVKNAFAHAYSAYEAFALPRDELLPITRGGTDNFNGWGLTMIDALDTMILMGFDEWTNKTIDHISGISFDKDVNVKVFEIIIRYLGGLLSAYSLVHNPILLSRADDLARALLPAFRTPAGLPVDTYNMKTGVTSDGWNGEYVFLAEIASCQLEFRYLAHLTGRAEYARHVDHVSQLLYDTKTKDGLLELALSQSTGAPQLEGKFTVGAFADSGYEYLLKQWLQTNQTEPKFREIYLSVANGIISKLLYISPVRKLLYVTDLISGVPSGKMEHLSCFIAGLFALGAASIPDLPPEHMWAAKGLANTCFTTYVDMKTGVGPNEVFFERDSVGERWVEALEKWEKEGGSKRGAVPPGVALAERQLDPEKREYIVRSPESMLRPETVESLYILWRTTKDPKWRDRGWEIFQAFQNATRLDKGYASLFHVDVVPPQPKDEMPSFFLAETLKYLYLLFLDEDVWPLDRWTLTTEAHPLPKFTWSEWERQHFGLNWTLS